MISSESSDDELVTARERLNASKNVGKDSRRAARTSSRALIGQKRSSAAPDPPPIEKQPRVDAKGTTGRAYTLSLALPGSILDNAQTKELATYVAGQVARAATIFQVDEIVVFEDALGACPKPPHARGRDACVVLARILQYLETPQYLRRQLFPLHPELADAGLLNPLDAPHHVRAQEWSLYREGVVTTRPRKENDGALIDVGLQRPVAVPQRIQPGVRVTVKLDETVKDGKKKSVTGHLVSCAEPREVLGLYWGYTTRRASSLRHVWTECPFPGGYDVKIGTSERGDVSVDEPTFRVPPFRHALVVVGGVAGIEACVDADETLAVSGEDARTLFDLWLNTCPQQGSRTIRSEEALLISLAALRPHFARNQLP
ncbi:hypothetical protein PsorP6_017124 [Peronosclerospora sorghi]|uniref:Uncharacterized protein n=1 Tax=Peronosclerospora sorghi TaxID=230839 RepID=A0ACC0WE98_9STRA|nr:hypothetical protein PsorP6_017124 [Peronosclerospora sorghi]